MNEQLRFDAQDLRRVVIVTGAGGGLGRAHALAFASRGARVVVNDLGGSMHGGGQSERAADKVVEEIQAAGGEAVANYDSVEDGDKICQTALDNWGRIDVVVNNAGILRDVSFHKMSQEDWDLVYRVHVYGAFRVTHAAWPYLRKQGYGRIIMTASAAGIYGNFGQANYAMAKLGLVGLSNTLAVEGGRKGIHVNTIAPIAGSRLTETVLPPEVTSALQPEYVSPLVLWLSHESCNENGGLFEVGGGYFGKLRWQRAKGDLMRIGRDMSPEAVKKAWPKVTGFDDATCPANIAESMGPIMENIQAGPSKGGNAFIDVDKALGYEYPDQTTKHDERDVALYGLGIGAAADPLNAKDLSLVYELDGGFVPFPTYGVIPAMNVIMDLAKSGHTAPGLNYGLDRLLHGEQYTEVMRPLPKSGTLTHKATIKNIYDKGKGAVVVTEARTFDEDGDLLVVNEFISFIRGAGGWGGDAGPSGAKHAAPERAADNVVEQKIPLDQALLYRLSGDWNPLHADPAFAKAFGFDRPILHGLCTFGFAARHVISTYADGDPRLFKSIRTRFKKSVFPGDTLVTEMWKEPTGLVHFRCKVKERDEVVISNAAIELYDVVPKKKAKPPAKAAAAIADPAAASKPNSSDIFAAIGKFVSADAALAKKVSKVFAFRLSEPTSVWTVDVKSNPGATKGEGTKADCTLLLSDADFMAMCTGKADAQKLYFGGQLKIEGDVMASQKLSFLKKLDPAMVVEAMNARTGGTAGASSSADAVEDRAGAAESASADVFLGIKAYIADNAALCDKVGKVFQFRLSAPSSVWTVDVKNAPGAVGPGELSKADTTLEISDADFMDMCSGKADPQKLYFGGKLKIAGDVMASQKLSFLQKIEPKWAKEAIARLKAAGEGFGARAATTTTAAADEPAAQKVMDALRTFISNNSAMAGSADSIVQLRIANPDKEFALVLKQKAEVILGTRSDAEVVVQLDDRTLGTWARGEASMRDLYQRGALRIDGDVAALKRVNWIAGILS